MKINDAGLKIIKDSEGLRLKSYLCPAGVLTIGYGHTGSDVLEDQTITEAQANQLLLQDVAIAEQGVSRFILVKLNENQFSALVSFVYNIGVSKFQSSTLLKLLNSASYDLAANEFDKWVYARGQILPGLVSRRAKEKALFLTPVSAIVATSQKSESENVSLFGKIRRIFGF